MPSVRVRYDNDALFLATYVVGNYKKERQLVLFQIFTSEAFFFQKAVQV